MGEPLLSIRDLKVEFSTRRGRVTALDGISLDLMPGETLGIVGESGCGKSITALATMGLIPDPPGRIAGGKIMFDGEDITRADSKRLRSLRGADISMIFQEPMTSLNPVFTAGDQIAEAIMLHQSASRAEADQMAVELLRTVGIPEPERRAAAYPHELSGGMRQRVMIAMAISCRPRVLIADEPTTALDVTVQAQIFDLMREIQEKFGVAIMLITHDMGAIAEMADQVAVMYAGRVVEKGSAESILDNPRHPYTRGLIGCIPVLGKDARRTGACRRSPKSPASCRRCIFLAAAAPSPTAAPAHSTAAVRKARCWKAAPIRSPVSRRKWRRRDRASPARRARTFGALPDVAQLAVRRAAFPARGARRVVLRAAGAHAGAGRRERFRQDDGGNGGDPAGAGACRRGAVRRRRTCCSSMPRRCGSGGAICR